MHRAMTSVHDMHSPIDSPFHHDFGLNYGTDPLTSHQTSQFQRRLILQYIINHSLQLILQSYSSKFGWDMENLQSLGLVTFTMSLAKRCELTLQQFQSVCIIMTRFFDRVDSVELSVKQIILGVVVTVQGFDSKSWDKITGMPVHSINLLLRYMDLDDFDLRIDESEMLMINDKMIRLIYARFNVV